MLKCSGKDACMTSLCFVLKHVFQILRERRFIFGAARIEPQRKSDLRCFINDFRPEHDYLLFAESNFQPDQLSYFDLAAAQHETSIPTQVGNGSTLARADAFPTGRQIDP